MNPAAASYPPLPSVRSLQHTRVTPPFAAGESDMALRLDEAARIAAEQIRWARCGPGREPVHIGCTTMLSMHVTGHPALSERLCEGVRQHSGVRLLGLVQAYQCAGWGYALRFLAGRCGQSAVAVTIIDLDLHRLQACMTLPGIGAVGFGVTTVVFDCPPQAQLPQCDGPYPNSAFNEFMHALRADQRKQGRSRVYMPFLTEDLAAVARRLLGADTLAPNLHGQCGHCFGSDPWVGLIHALQAGRCAPGEVSTVGSVAYGGYYALAKVALAEEVRWRLDTLATRAAAPMVASQALWNNAALPMALTEAPQ